jgi:hypothetical protein
MGLIILLFISGNIKEENFKIMKKIYTYFVFLCVFSTLNAQNENCTHNTSTNFQNPTNNSIPYNTSLVGDEFLNQFDWNALNGSGFLTTYQLQNMTYNQNMINIQSVASGSYYSYLYTGERMSYENGWELLLLNIGSFPNLDPLPNSDYADIPYIVLYNRYKGIIRLFANYGNGYISTQASIDAMRIELKFASNINGQNVLNGMFRLNSGKDITLDQKTNIKVMSSTTYHPNSANKWFSCDFQVAYDPCVCYYPSSLQIKFFAVENQDLELHGRQISIEQNLITGKAINQKDFLSNFDYTGATADGGMIMYKAMNYLVNDYEVKIDAYRAKLAQVNEHNKELDRYAFVIKAFKSIVLLGGSSLVSNVLNSTWVTGLTANVNEFLEPIANGNDSVIDVKKINTEAKKALSKEINTFFTENFKKQDLPKAPASPTATFSEMHFEGNLATNTNLDGPYFYTPGTYGSEGTGSPPLNEFSKYPIYNEALGVFALLEAPKLVRSNHFEIQAVSNTSYEVKNQMQFKLAEPLKYYFNPTLNYKSKNISAMLLFDVVNNRANYIRTAQENYKIYDNSINLFSESINTYSNTLIYNFDNDVNGIGDYTYRKDTIKYDSGFIPIDILNNFVVEIGTKEIQQVPGGNAYNYYPYGEDDGFYHSVWSATGLGIKAKLKLLIDVFYSSSHENEAPHEYTYVFTYDIIDSSITLSNVELYPNLESSNGNINQYQENLLFGNTIFNGGQINGCKLAGNTYSCRAWTDIIINGNIQTSNGYKVDFIAGNQIIVSPESILTPESSLSILPLLDFSKPMSESDFTYVKSFCKGENPNAPAYQANAPTKRILDLEANSLTNQEDPFEQLNWDFNIYPNPTTSTSTVVLSGNNETNYNIEVTDMMGKVVYTKGNRAETTQTVLDLTGISKGVYFVKVNTLLGTKMKQLVIQ